MRSLKENVLLGLQHGLGASVLYSIWVGLLALFRGSAYFEHYSMELGQIVAFYAVAGVTGGVIWGMLRPLNRWLLGAILNGYIIALPASLLGAMILVPTEFPEGEPFATTIIVALVGALLGATLGGMLWCQHRDRHRG